MLSIECPLHLDTAAQLKQLEIESTPTSTPARSNINVNMNNQVSLIYNSGWLMYIVPISVFHDIDRLD